MYSIKLWSDETIEIYEAHLVALRNCQEHGHEYEETFALVAKMITGCTFLTIFAFKG